MFKFLCLFALMATSSATSANQISETDSLLTNVLKMVKECGDRSMVLCMKERALQYFDTENGDVKLTEGISLIKTDDIPMGRSLNDAALPEEPEARENEVDALLVERVARFFGTHTLQFKVPKDSIQDMQRALEEFERQFFQRLHLGNQECQKRETLIIQNRKMPSSSRFFEILTLIVCITFAKAVTNVDPSSGELDQFRYCMRQTQHPSLRKCIGRTALNFLQRFDEQDNYTLFNDFVSTKDDKISARSLVNFLDTDPVDFRGILENAGAIMGQRGLEWHMDAIYPGLMFKIGPIADTNSVAQFILDPSTVERNFGYEEPSTARLLTKQYLLPFLLGFKFNLVALVPIVFAGICLLLKKSLFLAKFAIYLSSFLGVGGALTALSAGTGAGGFGGFGLFGGGGGGLPLGPPPFNPHAHAFGGGDGYIPGKAVVFNHQYESDELHHHPPYKRNDRKINFEKPREYTTRATLTATTSAPDRFYDYEKQVAMIHNRSGKLRSTNGKLGPTAYDDDEGEVKIIDFKTTNHEHNGWKVVDLRV